MNILFVDKDKELESMLHHFEQLRLANVFFCDSYQTSLDLYENNNIDIVIINFSLDFGQEILAVITEKTPKQRIITISEELVCSESRGGGFCKKHFNKLRLLKPISTKELISAIKDFDNQICKYGDKFDTVSGKIDVLDSILRRFDNVDYDKENKIITPKSIVNLVSVSSFLDKNSIPYTTDKDERIIITI